MKCQRCSRLVKVGWNVHGQMLNRNTPPQPGDVHGDCLTETDFKLEEQA